MPGKVQEHKYRSKLHEVIVHGPRQQYEAPNEESRRVYQTEIMREVNKFNFEVLRLQRKRRAEE